LTLKKRNRNDALKEPEPSVYALKIPVLAVAAGEK